MFLIARGPRHWQAGKVPTAKHRRERQIRAVKSRSRRRHGGMNTTQESKAASSIFIGRWTPKVLFSLRRKTLSARAVAPTAGERFTTNAHQDASQSRIRRLNRPACDAIESHCCRVLVDATGKDNHRSTRKHICRWAKRYRKAVSAEVRLRETETGK